MLFDSFGRPVESIRISITQRCNLKCFYCHKEGENTKNNKEMTPEEIQRIVEIASSFSIGKVKITGGEPLIRDDILEIVQKIKSIPEVKELSMTTNGIFLSNYAEKLKKFGLDRVNVSLHTLSRKKYKQITGVDAIEKVISGIYTAVNAGLNPVKVNVVLLRSINEDEISDLIKFATENKLVLQIIEFESAKETITYKKYHLETKEIERFLEKNAEKVFIRQMHHRRK
ncbi:MAG: GTP 3',8-cyclase MoaA, partial [Candidatus Jordarchaeaceae archaeon]